VPKKKKPIDLTTDEALKKLFPKKVRDKAKESSEKSENAPLPGEISIDKQDKRD
jgi:hypothetical protein